MPNSQLKVTRRSFPEKAEFLALPLALALVLAMFGLIYQASTASSRGREEAEAARQIEKNLDTLLSLLKDAETGQRGYLLTGMERYLEPYRMASKDIPGTMDALAALMAARRADQTQQVERLRPLVKSKLDELQRSIDLRRTQGPDAAMAVVITDEGKVAMDQIRDICAAIQRVNNERFAQSSEEARVKGRQAGLIGVFGSVLLFVLLVNATIIIRAGTRRRDLLIEALQKSEQDTREARDWLQTTLTSIGDAVISTDEAGNVTFLNDVAQDLTGWPQNLAAGKPLTEIFAITNEDTGEPVENPVSKALREGRVVGLANHTKLTSKSGGEIPIDDSAAPIRGHNGKIIGVVLVFRDISERKAAEVALRDSERQIRLMVDSIDQLAWMANADGGIFWYNRRWYEYTGARPSDMEGWGWQSVHDPAVLPAVMEKWTASVRTGEPFDMVFPLKGADGVFHSFLTRVNPVRDARGEVTRWFGTNTNVTRQLAIELELRRANEDLTQFAFAASHDLQEPLRMIASYSQLLIRSFPGELAGEASICVGFITEGTRRMQDLLRDLLAYTQVTGDGLQPMELVDLDVILQRTLENCKTAIEEAAATVTSERLPEVLGYEPHFLQLFQNLITNAIKYRGESAPRVHLSVAMQGGAWLVAVADNGIGIAPEYHEKIFGVFKRLHGRSIPGTGIGLAICQRVVERYGGRIWVESQANSGATFYFTLPVARIQLGG